MTKRLGKRGARANRERGASTVEFALILPIFIVLIVGMLEFARAANIKQVVVNAAREGARTVALPEGSQSNDALVQSRINAYLSSNSINPASCAISWTGMTEDPGTVATATVSCPFTLFYFGRAVQLIGGAASDGGTINLSSTSRMRNE